MLVTRPRRLQAGPPFGWPCNYEGPVDRPKVAVRAANRPRIHELGMEDVTFWEYKTVLLTLEVHKRRYLAAREGSKPARDSIESILNEQGEQGWELVTIIRHVDSPEDVSFTGVFKRPVSESRN